LAPTGEVDGAARAAHDRGVAGQTCGSGAAACIAGDEALAFVAGQLAPAARAAVERRIDACAECRAVVGEAAGRAEAERVRDARGETAVQRPAMTATPSGIPQAPARAGAAQGADRPVEARRAGARVTGRAAPAPALLVDEDGEVIGAVRRSAPRAEAVPAAGQARPAPRAEAGLVTGEVVGRYVVERPLGAGGMGVVSLARDPELRRPVVIKLVHPDVGSGEDGEDFEARLRREAQAMAMVSHANVVQIFDIGRRGDRVFLAMEFVDGQTLDHWLRERSRTADEILGVFRQAGAGLAAAHRAGLVHRDFKPSNVLVGRDGVVKVTDFGLARSVAGSEPGGAGATRQLRAGQRAAARTSGVHAVLTQADAVVGTPAYMAPEQAAGRAIDARTDQYALAVTLLDALIGQPGARRRIAPDDPAAIEVALSGLGIAPVLRAAIVRALAKDPAARFPAIDDLLHALAPAAPPGRSRRAALGIAGIALCGVTAAAWFVVGRREAAPACTSDAPGRWAAARDRVVGALSAGPRPFAGWDAPRIAEAIDAAVEALAAAETARCRGAPVAGRDGSADAEADCIARRKDALEAVITASSPPPDDPWSLVHRIERCESAGSPATAELRGKLRGATVAQAHEVAEAARKLGDERLAADASEVEGLAAIATGDGKRAAEALRAMNAAGRQSGSVGVQGRVLLHLIELRRASGEYDLAVEHRAALDALLASHGDAPRDVLPAARVEAEAFGDLGDVAAAFAAWDRAQKAANALADPDAQLEAAIGGARSLDVLRFDLEGARRAAGAAVAAGASASPAARAAALGAVADLAIAAGDGPGAAQALDQARQADPTQATGMTGWLRAQRIRALQGEVDGALAALASGPGPDIGARSASGASGASGDAGSPGVGPGPGLGNDALPAARIAIARGHILLEADHASEARSVLDRAAADLRDRSGGLPVAERFELQLAVCDARVAVTGNGATGNAMTGDCQPGRLAALIEKLHPDAPARVRLAELEARGAPADQPKRRADALQRALDILLHIEAAPLRVAELRWQIARLCADGSDCRRIATAAREAFQAAGRTAEVADIDRWLADPAATAPPRRDPAGPPP
jgi:hypothetical protein